MKEKILWGILWVVLIGWTIYVCYSNNTGFAKYLQNQEETVEIVNADGTTTEVNAEDYYDAQE